MNPPVPWNKLLPFALGLAAIHLLLVWAFARIVVPRHLVIRSDRLWYAAPAELDVVVLGDSHPRSAVVAAGLGSRALNLATGGEHYTRTFYRFRYLQRTAPRRVHAVVVPLDPNGFTSWNAEAFAPEYVWGRYVDFLELGRERHQWWGYAAKWAKARFFPYVGELRTLNQLRGARFGFADGLADGRFASHTPDERRALASLQADIHFGGATLVDPAQRRGFDRLVAWALGEGMAVLAVSYPLTDAYLEALEREQGDPRGAVQREVIDHLAETYPGVVHVDAARLFAGRPDLFADPHHLNAVGRARFTRELRRRLEAMDLVH